MEKKSRTGIKRRKRGKWKYRSTDRTKAVHIRRDDEDKELLSSSGDDAVWADFLFPVSPVSQTYQIELGIPSAIAVSAVMIGSIVNAGTRLVLPTLSDKVGRVGCIKGVLAVSVVAMAILTFTRSYTVTAAIILMYGCYGGIMGSFPSFTSSIFGIEHTGENYGFVMLGIVIATCGAPALSGFITGKGYGMHVVFGMGIVFAVIALICLTILGHNLKKEEHGKEQKNNGISNDERITGACEE